MKVKDIEDCEMCPLLEDYCKGGMSSSPSGTPIEPPCVGWDDPEEEIGDIVDTIESNQLAYEEELDRQFEEEKIREEKKIIKAQRAKESRIYVRKETRQINSLYKRIENNNRLISFGRAMSMTNSMMNIEDERPEKAKSILEIENETLRAKIEDIKIIKKKKLKDLRESRRR